MKVLVVATKTPSPPTDGGRLVLWHTLAALAATGLDLTLVAPADDEGTGGAEAVARPALVRARPRGLVASVFHAGFDGLPLTIARHALPAVAAQVRALLAGGGFDLVHVEQLQALHAVRRGPVPVVLRAQNVESELWRAGHRGALARLEGDRLRRFEAAALATCARVVALTRRDAAALRELAPSAHVVHVPPAFPGSLPAAPALAGDPAVVVAGSAVPANHHGTSWLIREVWPRVLRARPAARLHVFGEGEAGPGIVLHPRPADSTEAFPAGAIAAVAFPAPAGLRLRILEAWARGLPVVANAAAAEGLEAVPGVHLLVAADAGAFADGVLTLADDRLRQQRLVASGRQWLVERHGPATAAAGLVRVYEEAISAARAAR